MTRGGLLRNGVSAEPPAATHAATQCGTRTTRGLRPIAAATCSSSSRPGVRARLGDVIHLARGGGDGHDREDGLREVAGVHDGVGAVVRSDHRNPAASRRTEQRVQVALAGPVDDRRPDDGPGDRPRGFAQPRLSRELRAAVRAHGARRVVFDHRAGSEGRPAGRQARHVDESQEARGARAHGADEARHALGVGVHELRLGARPREPAEVHDHVDVPDRLIEGRGIAQVGASYGGSEGRELRRKFRSAHHRAHVVARPRDLPHHVCTDESTGAGHEEPEPRTSVDRCPGVPF